jgi:hypothetical protein
MRLDPDGGHDGGGAVAGKKPAAPGPNAANNFGLLTKFNHSRGFNI